MLRWVQFIPFIALVTLAVLSDSRTPLWYASLTLSMLCIVLWSVARRQIGDSFSIRPEARRLVTTGLYSKLRHPIYIFGTASFLFAVLAILGWKGLAVWVIVIPIQVVRAVREERVLAAAFGEQWYAYRAQTWF